MIRKLLAWVSVLVLTPFNVWGKGLIESAANEDPRVRQ